MTPLVELVANNTLICDPEKLVKGVSKAILTEPKNSNDALRLKTDGVNIQVSCQLVTNNVWVMFFIATATTTTAATSIRCSTLQWFMLIY